jgi:hypothetical protein
VLRHSSEHNEHPATITAKAGRKRMIPPFDIFRVGSDGQLVRKGTAETLDVAKLRIKILMASEPGDYVIYSQQTSHHTLVKADCSVKSGA